MYHIAGSIYTKIFLTKQYNITLHSRVTTHDVTVYFIYLNVWWLLELKNLYIIYTDLHLSIRNGYICINQESV